MAMERPGRVCAQSCRPALRRPAPGWQPRTSATGAVERRRRAEQSKARLHFHLEGLHREGIPHPHRYRGPSAAAGPSGSLRLARGARGRSEAVWRSEASAVDEPVEPGRARAPCRPRGASRRGDPAAPGEAERDERRRLAAPCPCGGGRSPRAASRGRARFPERSSRGGVPPHDAESTRPKKGTAPLRSAVQA